MTYNEFVFCSNLLYVNFKGKQLKDVFGNYDFVNTIIDNVIYDRRISQSCFKNSFEPLSILFFIDEILHVNGFDQKNEIRFEYKTVEEFLKPIKIPLEDIV